MKTVFKINYDNQDLEHYTGNIFYSFEKSFKLEEITSNLESVIDNFDDTTFYKKIVENNFKDFEEFKEQFKDYQYLEDEDLDNFEESYLEDLKYEVIEFLNDSFDSRHEYLQVINQALLSYGYEIDTVGYSNWAYALYRASNKQLAYDLWEGHNFYSISQYEVLEDKQINLIDSIGWIYAPTSEDIKQAINDNFVFEDEIVLIEDEESKYLDFKKVSLRSEVKTFINEGV